MKELFWLIISGLFFSSWLPGSSWRAGILRGFGAKVGKGVIIKSHVKIKFPWRLVVGDNCWIGESVWIDNLAQVSLAHDVCISQGAYLCTGSHDWAAETFDLITRPIKVCAHAWIGAKAKVGPGCELGEGAILTLGSVAKNKLKGWTIYTGIPATPVRSRAKPD